MIYLLIGCYLSLFLFLVALCKAAGKRTPEAREVGSKPARREKRTVTARTRPPRFALGSVARSGHPSSSTG